MTIKYEVSSWLNTDTMKPVYGVTVKTDKGKFNVADGDNKPMFFDTEAEAKDMVDTMNSMPRCGVCGKPLTFGERKVDDPELGTCCAEHFDLDAPPCG